MPVLNTCQLQFADPTQKNIAKESNEHFTNIRKTVAKNLPEMNRVLPESPLHSMFL